jgi:hypothetical protein
MAREIKKPAASVHQLLLNKAKQSSRGRLLFKAAADLKEIAYFTVRAGNGDNIRV